MNIFIISLLLLTNVYAHIHDKEERHQFALLGGLSIGSDWSRYSAGGQGHYPFPGFMTRISYARSSKSSWQLAMSSYASMGHFSGINFRTRDIIFENTRGRYRDLKIGPSIQYRFQEHELFSLRPYLGVGPIWGQRTFKFSRADYDASQIENPPDRRNFKTNYEMRGAQLIFGLNQEDIGDKTYPLFFESTFTWLESRRVLTIDASNFRKTNILSRSRSTRGMQNLSLYLSVGLRFL